MFKITHYEVADPYAEAEEMIRSQRPAMRVIGSGVYGDVWSHRDANIVLKTGSATGGYYKFLELMSVTKHNRWLPKIYGAWTFRRNRLSKNPEVYVVAIEKLLEWEKVCGRYYGKDHKSFFNSFSRAYADFVNLLDSDGYWVEEANDWGDIYVRRTKLPKAYDFQSEAKEAIDLIKKAARVASPHNPRWDLHIHNFMVRPAKNEYQLVCTDPIHG